ncbi:MAG TPA: hypothetical protein VFF07_15255 [Actinomycetota bacterium]|nr:hypothetical protein [Actinomycetota bacterium]
MVGAESPELDPVITSLAASFEAAMVRSEDEAAADLALSLRQGRALIEVLRLAQGIEAHLSGGARHPVTLLGDDFCGIGEPATRVLTWETAVFQSKASGAAPMRFAGDLIALAREWTRRSAHVEIVTAAGGLRGRLAEAGSDYLCVMAAAGPRYVPRASLTEMTLLRERSSDAL